MINIDRFVTSLLVAGHAILIIFFLVIPSLIGGFGKNQNKNNRLYYINDVNNNKFNFNKDKLDPYLAGLIEGDGIIYVPLKELKSTNKPLISIAFNKDDESLAIYLSNLWNIGNIYLFILKKNQLKFVFDKFKRLKIFIL